ncbi:hypothetical protein SMD22_00590 (plasmid) [Brevibacillus halotolerans]|nr:hypothetical protein SMD22_00590 [Brevibacillus halotolerans]
MSELSFGRMKELDERFGIKDGKAKDSVRGGISLSQQDSSGRALIMDELMESMLPAKLPDKLSRIQLLKKAMDKEVSDYREAVADDETYSQGEADEELHDSLVCRLYKEKFTLIHKLEGEHHDNIKDSTINIVWKMIKDSLDLENYLIEWDGVLIPAPTKKRDYERFGDFICYIASKYEISYQL